MVPVEISPLQVKALLTFSAGLKTLGCGLKKMRQLQFWKEEENYGLACGSLFMLGQP